MPRSFSNWNHHRRPDASLFTAHQQGSPSTSYTDAVPVPGAPPPWDLQELQPGQQASPESGIGYDELEDLVSGLIDSPDNRSAVDQDEPPPDWTLGPTLFIKGGACRCDQDELFIKDGACRYARTNATPAA